MKLINKTLLYYFLISLPLLLLAALFSYYVIKNEIRDGTDESLLKEKKNAEALINKLKDSTKIYLSTDSLSYISLIYTNNKKTTFIDTILYDRTEKENLRYRMLRSFYSLQNKNYLIIVSKTTLEEDELIEGLFSAFGLLLIFLLVAFFLLNWLLAKTLWKPFYKTLSQLHDYEIKNHEQFNFITSTITEFNQLNIALNKMTLKIYSDYQQQKQFTENASHEMQTPLAVIKASISLLIQSPNLKEEEMNQLQVIDNTTNKLSQLNKALILLSKIENNQFKQNKTVNLKEVIEKCLENYLDVLQYKKIEVEVHLENKSIQVNQTLIEVLISNLIQNAIRHNHEEGKISILLTNTILEITNTGEALNIKPEELFVRFKKSEKSRESLGLGLSIVKGILDHYGYSIAYSYKNSLHTFNITFS